MSDLATLLALHHGELDELVAKLVTLDPRTSEWQAALDSLRLGLHAHMEAEEHAWRTVFPYSYAARIVDRLVEEHLLQERLVDRMSFDAPAHELIQDALELRASLLSHDEQERLLVLPSVRSRATVAEYAQLAPAYASRRAHNLGRLSEPNRTVGGFRTRKRSTSRMKSVS